MNRDPEGVVMGIERTAYFTAETIGPLSFSMRKQLRSLRRRHLPLRPGRCALLLLDVQQVFLDPASHAYVPAGAAILPGALAMHQAFRDRGWPAVCTRHGHPPDDAGMMTRWWRHPILVGSPEAALYPRLAEADAEILDKRHYDAFRDTDLHERLSGRGVEQVIIAGFMTHLCCDTTARSAFMQDYEVFVCVDGTATYTEALHRGSLMGLAHGVAEMILVDEVLAVAEDDG
jgi:nicotinamidase-related amidase